MGESGDRATTFMRKAASLPPFYALSSVPPPLSADRLSTLFHRRTVALLMGGQSFRGPNQAECQLDDDSFAEQRALSLSWVEHFAEPLEALGARVRVCFTFPECGSAEAVSRQRDALTGWFNSGSGGLRGARRRVAASRAVRSLSMSDGWAHLWRLYAEVSAAASASHDYVVHARHDVALVRPLPSWPSDDFSKVLFQQMCWVCCAEDSTCHRRPKSPTADGGCQCGDESRFIRERVLPDDPAGRLHGSPCAASVCVADFLVWVPRRFVPTWAAAVQASNGSSAVMHTFIRPFAAAARRAGLIGESAESLASSVGFLLPPNERGERYVDMHRRRDRLASAMNLTRTVIMRDAGTGRVHRAEERGARVDEGSLRTLKHLWRAFEALTGTHRAVNEFARAFGEHYTKLTGRPFDPDRLPWSDARRRTA